MPQSSETPDLSIVLSCFHEQASIEEFHQRLTAVLTEIGRSYEIVYVDDGSSDATLEKLHAIQNADPNVAAVVDLFRNSGQAAALTAGSGLARGRLIVFLDSDLQLDPEDLPKLLDEYAKGYDIVGGYREERQDSLLRRIPSVLANMAMRRVARANLRDFGCTFWVMNAELIRSFEFGPRRPIRLPYLVGAAGRVTQVAVNHRERPYGRSGWTFAGLLHYYVESLIGISQRPFQLLSAVLLLLASVFGLRLAVNLLWPFSLLAEVTNGLILNAVVVSFFVTLATAALIGEYALRSYAILLGQPAFIIRSIRRPGGAEESA